MRTLLATSLSAAALMIAAPLHAQAESSPAAEPTPAAEGGSKKGMDEFAAMMGNLFQTEPLTAEQEARLPAARGVVATMMPKGFYGKLMNDTMDRMVRPMMSTFAKPEFILGTRLDVDPEVLAKLDDADKAQAMRMLDPAYDRRIDAIIDVLKGRMTGMFAVLEDPFREGLSKAYAVRFNDAQLADIAGFFATPTGAVYAKESMALFSDPQVMQASMKALPAMLSGFGDMDSSIKQAMASLPAERGYKDLSESERAQLAGMLGVKSARLAQIVKPPKPIDGGKEDGK